MAAQLSRFAAAKADELSRLDGELQALATQAFAHVRGVPSPRVTAYSAVPEAIRDAVRAALGAGLFPDLPWSSPQQLDPSRRTVLERSDASDTDELPLILRCKKARRHYSSHCALDAGEPAGSHREVPLSEMSIDDLSRLISGIDPEIPLDDGPCPGSLRVAGPGAGVDPGAVQSALPGQQPDPSRSPHHKVGTKTPPLAAANAVHSHGPETSAQAGQDAVAPLLHSGVADALANCTPGSQQQQQLHKGEDRGATRDEQRLPDLRKRAPLWLNQLLRSGYRPKSAASNREPPESERPPACKRPRGQATVSRAALKAATRPNEANFPATTASTQQPVQSSSTAMVPPVQQREWPDHRGNHQQGQAPCVDGTATSTAPADEPQLAPSGPSQGHSQLPHGLQAAEDAVAAQRMADGRGGEQTERQREALMSDPSMVSAAVDSGMSGCIQEEAKQARQEAAAPPGEAEAGPAAMAGKERAAGDASRDAAAGGQDQLQRAGQQPGHPTREEETEPAVLPCAECSMAPSAAPEVPSTCQVTDSKAKRRQRKPKSPPQRPWDDTGGDVTAAVGPASGPSGPAAGPGDHGRPPKAAKAVSQGPSSQGLASEATSHKLEHPAPPPKLQQQPPAGTCQTAQSVPAYKGAQEPGVHAQVPAGGEFGGAQAAETQATQAQGAAHRRFIPVVPPQHTSAAGKPMVPLPKTTNRVPMPTASFTKLPTALNPPAPAPSASPHSAAAATHLVTASSIDGASGSLGSAAEAHAIRKPKTKAAVAAAAASLGSGGAKRPRPTLETGVAAVSEGTDAEGVAGERLNDARPGKRSGRQCQSTALPAEASNPILAHGVETAPDAKEAVPAPDTSAAVDSSAAACPVAAAVVEVAAEPTPTVPASPVDMAEAPVAAADGGARCSAAVGQEPYREDDRENAIATPAMPPEIKAVNVEAVEPASGTTEPVAVEAVEAKSVGIEAAARPKPTSPAPPHAANDGAVLPCPAAYVSQTTPFASTAAPQPPQSQPSCAAAPCEVEAGHDQLRLDATGGHSATAAVSAAGRAASLDPPKAACAPPCHPTQLPTATASPGTAAGSVAGSASAASNPAAAASVASEAVARSGTARSHAAAQPMHTASHGSAAAGVAGAHEGKPERRYRPVAPARRAVHARAAASDLPSTHAELAAVAAMWMAAQQGNGAGSGGGAEEQVSDAGPTAAAGTDHGVASGAGAAAAAPGPEGEPPAGATAEVPTAAAADVMSAAEEEMVVVLSPPAARVPAGSQGTVRQRSPDSADMLSRTGKARGEEARPPPPGNVPPPTGDTHARGPDEIRAPLATAAPAVLSDAAAATDPTTLGTTPPAAPGEAAATPDPEPHEHAGGSDFGEYAPHQQPPSDTATSPVRAPVEAEQLATACAVEAGAPVVATGQTAEPDCRGSEDERVGAEGDGQLSRRNSTGSGSGAEGADGDGEGSGNESPDGRVADSDLTKSSPDDGGGQEDEGDAGMSPVEREEWRRRREEIERQRAEAASEREAARRARIAADATAELERRIRQRLAEHHQLAHAAAAEATAKEDIRTRVRDSLQERFRKALDEHSLTKLLRQLNVVHKGTSLRTAEQRSKALKTAKIRFHPDKVTGSLEDRVYAEEVSKLLNSWTWIK